LRVVAEHYLEMAKHLLLRSAAERLCLRMAKN